MAAAEKEVPKSPLSIWELQQSQNIEPLLSEEASSEIGRDVVQGYETDKQSRKEWEARMDNAIKLALQMVEQKNYPWPKASNVKFPLVTIAALQFSARAYPALVKGPDVVKYRVNGEDPAGQKAARAQRVSRHMSYQLTEEDENWEEDFDKAMIALPILGTVFKKSFFDPLKGRNVSRLTLPQNLVVNYYARAIEECERKTETFPLYEREIKARQLKGVFSVKELAGHPVTTGNALTDKRQGLSPPPNDKSRPRELLEQHLYRDLDGDGYPEPYVVTVDLATKKALRIVSRFAKLDTEQSIAIKKLQDQQKTLQLQMQALAQSVPAPTGQETREHLIKAQEVVGQVQAMQAQGMALEGEIQKLDASNKKNPKVLYIEAEEHFTKYGFIPSPDGGFYDLGLGALLGPLNDSVNTLINQLIDVGTLQSGSQGFIGKGARIKGGRIAFEPFEWKRVNVAGQTLRDSIVPLPVNQPSAVLFSLLSMLISYSEKVSSVNDAMTGSNPGQNTPAYSMHSMLEQGMQVFNGIFKRLYRAFRRELKKLYVLNRTYLNPIEYFETLDGQAQVLQSDYSADEKDIYPAADPNAFSNMEKLMKAHFLAERAATVPGYNPVAVELFLLEQMEIADRQKMFPVDEEGNALVKPPVNPEIEIAMAEEQRHLLESKSRVEINSAEAASKMDVDQSVVLLNMVKAGNLDAQAAIQKFEAITERMKVRQEAVIKVHEAAEKRIERKEKAKSGTSD